jgi:hypothetical protein
MANISPIIFDDGIGFLQKFSLDSFLSFRSPFQII